MISYDVDTALAEVPVNSVPLTDDTDFVTIETAVAYNAAGMALYWHFVTCAGAYTATAVTPTTAGTYDWAHQQQGMYTIEIPASGGASINNDTEGFGWFTGFATGVLPWRGPTLCFRAAALNDADIEGGDLRDVNVTEVNGVTATTFDGTIASATASTVTFPTTDAGSNTIPDNDQYEWHEIYVVGGTGINQCVLLTTAGASARQYNVLSGTMTTQLDNTSKYLIGSAWKANTTEIAGNTEAATRLDRAARCITKFTVGSGSSITSVVTSSMDPAAAVTDQFKGLILAFDKDTTSASLRGQKTDITASTSGGVLTCTALTTSPASGDTGTIE